VILISTLGGLGALLFWGLGDYFAGKSGQEADEYLTNFVLQLVVAVILFPIVLWNGFSFAFDTAMAVMLLVSLLFTVAFISYIKAMSAGSFGVTVPIANSYALVTLLIGVIFFEFALTFWQIVVLVIIVAGIIALGFDRTTFRPGNIQKTSVTLALVTMLSWGVAFALIDTVVTDMPCHHLLFLLPPFMTIFTLIAHVVARRKVPQLSDLKYSNIKYAYQSGLLNAVGFIAFFAASEYVGSVIIAAVIAAASPLVTSALAHFFDGEVLSYYKRIGAVVVVAGVMLLNVL